MARIARVVIPDFPHHVVQRGNRRMKTFFSDSDYMRYISELTVWSDKKGLEIWAYCLMPNHVHLIVSPSRPDSMHSAIGEAHRRYSAYVNKREGWKGYLWQGRFSSCVLDGRHLMAAARYIEMNPVKSGLVESPEQWKWSSARAHLEGRNDALVKAGPLLERITEDWAGFLRLPQNAQEIEAISMHTRTGRPLGDDRFIASLEERTGRYLKRKKPGPKERFIIDSE